MKPPGIDDITITLTGDKRSRAAANMRALIELAVVRLGGTATCDGPLVSSYDLHGSNILIKQHFRAPRAKKRRRR